MAKSAVVDQLRKQRTDKEQKSETPQSLHERLYEDMRSVPKYQRLRPKEARLSSEQLLGLKRITQHVIDTRPIKNAEVVTENTLIRIAVDYLIATWDTKVRGSDEDELRSSFFKHAGLEEPKS